MIKLTIMSADAKREMDLPLKIMQQMQEEKRQIERTIAKEKTIEFIFNTIKGYMEKSIGSITTTFYYSEFKDCCPNNIYNQFLRECFEIVETLFNEAGYETDFYEYGRSWQNRSGKFGTFRVSWSK